MSGCQGPIGVRNNIKDGGLLVVSATPNGCACNLLQPGVPGRAAAAYLASTHYCATRDLC